MWWEPRNANESEVSATIESLRGWFREQWSSAAPSVWGLGSIILGEPSRTFPLLLVGPDFSDIYRGYPFASYHYPYAPPIEDRFRSSRGEGNPFFPRVDLPLRILFPGTITSFPLASLQYPLVVLPVHPPRATSRASGIVDKFVPYRRPLVCGLTGKVGTAGFTARSAQGPLVISAGHVFPAGVNSPVFEERGARLGSFQAGWGRRRFGMVRNQVVPSGQIPGYDVAVIVPDRPRPAATASPRLVTRLDEPKSVVTHGSTSGMVREAAALMGALVQVGDPATSTLWANCWMMGPSESLTGGDSGAAVFVQEDSSLLGTVVGASYFKSTGRRLIHYVQDAFSVQRDVLNQWNIQL